MFNLLPSPYPLRDGCGQEGLNRIQFIFFMLDFIILGFFVFVIFTFYFIFQVIDRYNLPDNLLFILAFLTSFLLDFFYLDSFSKDLYLCYIFIILIEFINIAILRNRYLRRNYAWNTRNLNYYNIFLDAVRITLIIATIVLLLCTVFKIIPIEPNI